MTSHKELLQQAKEGLSQEYLKAVSLINLPEKISDLGKKNELSMKQLDVFDQEVVYLILHITDSAEFTDRLANKLVLDDEKLLKIIQEVTENILKPLENKLDEGVGGTSDEIPVPPPPPGGDTPTPSYGGTSDPYREPAEE